MFEIRLSVLWRLGSSAFSFTFCHHPASCSTTVGLFGSFVPNVSDPIHAPPLFGLNVPAVWLYECGGSWSATNLIVTSAEPRGSIDEGNEPTICHGPLIVGLVRASGWS